MKKHSSKLAFAAAVFMILFAAFGNFGVEISAQSKPTVALIRADWCRACQQLEPTYMNSNKNTATASTSSNSM